MDDSKTLTMQTSAGLPYSQLKLYEFFDSPDTRVVFIAGYRRLFELQSIRFAENPANFLQLQETMSCYEHLVKNMSVKDGIKDV